MEMSNLQTHSYFLVFLAPSRNVLFLFLSSLSLGSNNSRANSNWKTMKTKQTSSNGTDNRGMVDYMVSAVGRYMLLDSDLGNMVNLVVNLNSNLMNNWGGNSNRSSMSNSNWCSMGNSKRCSRSRGIDTPYKTMSKKTMSQNTTSNNLSICISCRGSKTTGNEGRENNKGFHVGSRESVTTIPM